MNEEDAVRDFLGERPGADELSEWRGLLQRRLEALREEEKKGPPEAVAPLQGKIAQLARQIAALQEEEAVTRFVEDSVRVTLAMGAAYEGHDQTEE